MLFPLMNATLSMLYPRRELSWVLTVKRHYSSDSVLLHKKSQNHNIPNIILLHTMKFSFNTVNYFSGSGCSSKTQFIQFLTIPGFACCSNNDFKSPRGRKEVRHSQTSPYHQWNDVASLLRSSSVKASSTWSRTRLLYALTPSSITRTADS